MPWGACHHRRRGISHFSIEINEQIHQKNHKTPQNWGQNGSPGNKNMLDSLSLHLILWAEEQCGSTADLPLRCAEMVNGTLAQNRWCPGSHHVCHRISSDHPALCVAQEVKLKWFDEPLKKVISWHPDVQLEAASLPMLVATTSIYDLEARLQHLGPRSHSRNDTHNFSKKDTSFFGSSTNSFNTQNLYFQIQWGAWHTCCFNPTGRWRQTMQCMTHGVLLGLQGMIWVLGLKMGDVPSIYINLWQCWFRNDD